MYSPQQGEEKRYLSLSEQDAVIQRLYADLDKAPLNEKIFFKYGEHLSLGALAITSLLSWRAGFRGFGLHRFGRGRIATLVCSFACPASGALVHSMFVKSELTEIFRSETAWSYATKSILAHQFGIFNSIAGSLSITYFFAQKCGILPIPDDMVIREVGVRRAAIKLILDRLRPHFKTFRYCWLASTIFMFGVGFREYQESCNMLAKQNRSTLSRK